MFKSLHILFLSVLLMSCGNREKNKADQTYFGGTIVNPKTDWVYLYKGEVVVDSVKVDEEQSFLFTLPKNTKGLYKFVVKPEYQYVYFEPGDSLMIFLNPLEFDESLAFSGYGSERNNFLVDMFLENEADAQKIVSYYQLSVEDFLAKMDSLRESKIKKLNALAKKYEYSDAFEKIAYGSINFINYRAREIYPFINSNYLTAKNPLPDNYYEYRKNIDFSDSIFESYYSFKSYLVSFVDNLSFFDCEKNCNVDNHIPKFSFHHNLHKLEIIDSVFQQSEIKDLLLMESAINYLNREADSTNIVRYMTMFHKIDKSEALNKKIESLADRALQLSKGKPLPEIEVADLNGNIFKLNDKFTAPLTVLFFWDFNLQRRFKLSHNRIADLQKNNPDIAFYGISTSGNHDKWVQESINNNLNPNMEFRAVDFNKVSDLLMINDLSRTFVLDKHGRIINASANLFDPAIEVLLAGN